MSTIKQIKHKAQEELELHKEGKLLDSSANASDYHQAENLIYAVLDITEELPETYDVYTFDELNDQIMETADSNTPVYNDDLAKWFGENWTAYNEVREELGNDGMGEDIMRNIMITYCITLERAIQELLTDYITEIDNNE